MLLATSSLALILQVTSKTCFKRGEKGLVAKAPPLRAEGKGQKQL